MYRKGLAGMSQDNQITLRGYLTAEPKYQKTATAMPLTEIRVGSTPRRLNRETGEWQDAPTSYYRVKCWRRLAINAASSLHKGDMVVVRGRFYMNNWVDNQQRPRATLEIEADSLGHDLAYGWSHFLRGRPHSERAAGVNAGEMARQDIGSANADAATTSTPATATRMSRCGRGRYSWRPGRPGRARRPADPRRSHGDSLGARPFRSRRVIALRPSRATPAASGLTDSDSLPSRKRCRSRRPRPPLTCRNVIIGCRAPILVTHSDEYRIVRHPMK